MARLSSIAKRSQRGEPPRAELLRAKVLWGEGTPVQLQREPKLAIGGV